MMNQTNKGSNHFIFAGKTAVITGGSKGIGCSIAKLFAREGAEVHILDIDQEYGNIITEEIRREGGKAFFQQVNIANQSMVLEIFERIFSRKKLDILVNNAGIAHIGRLDQTAEKDFDRIFSVNVKGVYNCSFSAVEKMKFSGGGVILNMASVAATLGIPDRFAYSASKGAVISMTYSIARDYLNDNIRCNAISPARVHTPFVDEYLKQHYPGKEKEMFEELSKTQPIGRMGKPDEIAAMALYLCSDEAAFITGSNFTIDGGFTTLKV